MGLQHPIQRPMAFSSRIRLRAACLLAVLAALAVALPAVAAASGQSKQTASQSKASANRTGMRDKVVGGLPFTGLDVIALAAVAVSLTSTGLALRRISVGNGEPA